MLTRVHKKKPPESGFTETVDEISGKLMKGFKKVPIRKKNTPKSKGYNLTLHGEDITRFEWLQERIGESGTQSEVFSASLTILEGLVKEYEQGSMFYIKRQNADILQYDIFENVS